MILIKSVFADDTKQLTHKTIYSIDYFSYRFNDGKSCLFFTTVKGTPETIIKSSIKEPTIIVIVEDGTKLFRETYNME